MKNENILTLKALKEMEPHTIFAGGEGLIEHPWFNGAKSVSEGGTLEEDGRSTKVKWVAVRGDYYDWAIYHSMDANFISAKFLDDPAHLLVESQTIADWGNKLHNEEKIREFVPCDDEALSLYRH